MCLTFVIKGERWKNIAKRKRKKIRGVNGEFITTILIEKQTQKGVKRQVITKKSKSDPSNPIITTTVERSPSSKSNGRVTKTRNHTILEDMEIVEGIVGSPIRYKKKAVNETKVNWPVWKQEGIHSLD